MKKLMIAILVLLNIQKATASSSNPVFIPVTIEVDGFYVIDAYYTCKKSENNTCHKKGIAMGMTKIISIIKGTDVYLSVSQLHPKKQFIFHQIKKATHIGCKGVPWLETCDI